MKNLEEQTYLLNDRVIYYPIAEQVYYQNVIINEEDDTNKENNDQKEVEVFEEVEENEGGNPRINRIKRFLKNSNNKKQLYGVSFGLLLIGLFTLIKTIKN